MITILEWLNVCYYTQYVVAHKFMYFIGECVKIPKYQCQSSPENGDGLSAGAIVGIVIGSIIAILICVAAKLIFHNI